VLYERILGVWQAYQAERFPRLRSICLDRRNVYTTSYAEAMFAFITPAILTVHMFIDMAFCSLLAKTPAMVGIASRCRATTFGLHMTFNPSLLRGQHPMPAVTEALSVLVCSLQPLACVTIPAFLAGSTLPHLAACVDLRELNIIGRAAAMNNTIPVELPPRSFPVLDTVCIEESGTTARLSKAVFQRPPTEHLQHVSSYGPAEGAPGSAAGCGTTGGARSLVRGNGECGTPST
jgi:hypothetical protein